MYKLIKSKMKYRNPLDFMKLDSMITNPANGRVCYPSELQQYAHNPISMIKKFLNKIFHEGFKNLKSDKHIKVWNSVLFLVLKCRGSAMPDSRRAFKSLLAILIQTIGFTFDSEEILSMSLRRFSFKLFDFQIENGIVYLEQCRIIQSLWSLLLKIYIKWALRWVPLARHLSRSY